VDIGLHSVAKRGVHHLVTLDSRAAFKPCIGYHGLKVMAVSVDSGLRPVEPLGPGG